MIAEAPKRIPLIGHALPLLADPLQFLTALPETGDLVRVRVGPVQVVVVCDPELTRQVLVDDRTFDKGGPSFDSGLDDFGDGLASVPHSRHRRRRRLAQPSFHRSRYENYARMMSGHIDTATKGWRAGDVLDVRTEMTSLSMAIAVDTMFSSALPAARLRQAVDDLQTFVSGIHRTMVLPGPVARLPLPANVRYRAAVDRLRRTVREIVAERRATGGDHNDLLSSLLLARDGDDAADQGLTDSEVVDEVLTFFAAGSETIAGTISWALYLLASNPEEYQRLREEVDRVVADDAATFEDVPKLEFTNRVVTEALRLYPPAWIVTRSVTADTQLGAHTLPAGTFVAWSPYILHRQDSLFENAARFVPDRWDDALHEQPHRTSFITFGGGARKCIGDHFSYVEATLALATITKRWTLELVDGERVKPAPSTTLYPKNLRMRVVSGGPA
ncbi:cytochrome P450 [Lentzea rhizosphaerae]|uniref:Cytochrome P450 n=1 Tax=Lentzea rhizosphaerae TaxID=2041025 RepID=A0ABV8BS01_9PSEU